MTSIRVKDTNGNLYAISTDDITRIDRGSIIFNPDRSGHGKVIGCSITARGQTI